MSRTGPVTNDTSTVALGLAQIRVGVSASNITTATAALSSSDSIGALASTKYTGSVDYWKLESGFPLLEDHTIAIRESAMLECEFKEITSYNLALARGIDPNADVSATVAEVDETTSSGTNTWATVPITVDDLGGVVNDTWTVVFASATTGSIYGAETGHVHDFVNLTSEMAPDDGANEYFAIPANFFTGTWAADEVYVFKTTAFVSGTAAYASAHSGSINLGTMSAPVYVRMEAVYTYPNAINHMYIIFPRANVTSSLEIDMQAEDNANVPITFEAKRADAEVSGGHSTWNSAPLGKIYFD